MAKEGKEEIERQKKIWSKEFNVFFRETATQLR